MRIRKRNVQGESSGARPAAGGGSHIPEQLVQAVQAEKTTANEARDEARELGAELRGAAGHSVGGGNERAEGTNSCSPTLVVDLRQSGEGAFQPYMNLDEFVSSLVTSGFMKENCAENCFPAEKLATPGVISTVQSHDPCFERLAGGSSGNFATYAELDTSLRLGQASSDPAMAPSSGQDRGKSKMDFFSKEFESGTEVDVRQNLSPEFRVKRRVEQRAVYCTTTEDAALEDQNEKTSPPPSPIEACDESDTARRNLEAAQVELESSPSDHQTRKSSTESMEPRFSRKRRACSATDRPKRRRLSSPAPTTEELPPILAADHPAKQPRRSLMFSLYTVFHEVGRVGLTAGEAMSIIMQQGLPGFEDPECGSRRHVTKLLRNSPYFMELGEGKFALCSAMIDEEQDEPSHEEEAAGSDSSPESSRRPRVSTLPVPSSTNNEKRKQEVELERKSGGTTTAATAGASSQQTKTTETVRKPSGRSGRPKRLQYLKQDNVEELGNQCNRSDGKGWTCPLLAKTGYQLCDHHLDKLRCKPGSRSKYNKKKKKKKKHN